MVPLLASHPVVSKHVACFADRDPKMAQSCPQVHGLLKAQLSSKELEAMHHCFNFQLLLAESVNECLVQKAKQTCHSSSSEHTVMQVSIKVAGKSRCAPSSIVAPGSSTETPDKRKRKKTFCGG